MTQAKLFFMYSPEDGMHLFETEQQAIDAANEEIENYKDSGEWEMDVTSVIVGKLTHRAKEANVQKPQGKLDEEGHDEAGDYWGDCEMRCDYTMQPVAAAPAQDEPSECDWRQEDDENMPQTYRTRCGQLWSFIEGGPADNSVKFCHCCGKPVKEVAAA